jgi:hypothetical protein
MTEKINREAKERHAAEMAAYEARIGSVQVRVISRTRQTKGKKTIDEKLDFFR